MARKAKKTVECVELKIILDDTEPTVWRKILVPKRITLERLHIAIQLAMGWWNYHLFQFVIDGVRYEDAEDDWDFGDEAQSLDTRLDDAVVGIRKFQYLYDYGDGWRHTIRVGKSRKVSADTLLPACIEGENACPPEDCGGTGGFGNMKEILKDKKHEEHEEMLTWVGGSYDHNKFSLDEANARLQGGE